MHVGAFAGAMRAELVCVPRIDRQEQRDDDYPLLLVTGRRLPHFNSGTMTQRSPNAQLEPEDWLDITTAAARRQHLRAGEWVRLRSRYGEAQLLLSIVDSLRPGELFCRFHQPLRSVNRVTSPVRHRLTDAPEYKRTAVRIECPSDAIPTRAEVTHP